MADLLKSAKTSLTTFRKGDIVKGRITKLTPSEILVDINAKTEAVVLEKEKRIMRSLLSLLKVGDEVSVSILHVESDMGHPVVSLRRFIGDMLFAQLEKKQQTQEPLPATVKEATRGGFLVDTKLGLSGFLPQSHSLLGQNVQDAVGKTIDVYVLELNRQAHKIIFSQRKTFTKEDFEKETRGLKVGQKITAVISNITPFGIFAALPINNSMSLDGLIHISEISWDKVSDIPKEFAPGQPVDVQVIGFDKEAKRVDLSIKRLFHDPFAETLKKYTIDQKVKGNVAKVLATGVLVELEEGVEGLIRKEKIPPNVTYQLGDEVNATVSRVDAKRRRLILVPVLLRKTIGYR